MNRLTFKLYGYVEGADADSPSILEEVVVAACPSSLRTMAAFFEQTADVMESHGDDFEHEHLVDFVGDCGNSPSLVLTRNHN